MSVRLSGALWLDGAPLGVLRQEVATADVWLDGAPALVVGATDAGPVIHPGALVATGTGTMAAQGGAAGLILTDTAMTGATSTALVGLAIPPLPPVYATITSLPYFISIPPGDINAVRSDPAYFGGVGAQVPTIGGLWLRFDIPDTNHIYGVLARSASGAFFGLGYTHYADPKLTAMGGTFEAARHIYPTGSVPFVVGKSLYFKLLKSGSGTISENFEFYMDEAGIDLPVPTGSVIINDDTGLNYGVALAPDGTFLTFLTTTPSSEFGATLSNGISAWHANVFGQIWITDADQDIVAQVAFDGAGFGFDPVIFSNYTDLFYYALYDQGTDLVRLGTVTPTGTITAAVWILPADATDAGTWAVSRDDTILYYATPFYSNNPAVPLVIKQYDLINEVALPDLYSIPAVVEGIQIAVTPNGHSGEILVLGDGSLVTWFTRGDTETEELLHISDAGVLLHQYSYDNTVWAIDHLAISEDDPNSVWLWLYDQAEFQGVGRIAEIDLATGLEVAGTGFTTPLFSAGTSLNQRDTILFGPSNSCTFLLSHPGPPPPPDPIPPPLVDYSTVCPCPANGPGVPLDTIPDPIVFVPWMKVCVSGCVVDSVIDVDDGENWG